MRLVDAVVDLRVHMVGAACQHDDALALTARSSMISLPLTRILAMWASYSA